MNNPTPQQIRDARHKAGLSQTQAALMIYVLPRTWRAWEQGTAPMHPAHWELFQIKAITKKAEL